VPAAFARTAGEILRSGKPIEDRLREFSNAVSVFIGGDRKSVV